MASVLITGGSGFIGQFLSKILIEEGYDVAILSRQKNKNNSPEIPSYYWDVNKNIIDQEALTKYDYIIHLAGENIGEKRWTKKRKEQILNSRINSANLILQNIDREKHKLKAFISASAIGYYGAITSDKILHESDPPGNDFMGKVCQKWEEAADSFNALGSRVVKLRTGIVLSEKGGALPRLSLLSRLGLGSALGNGKQYMPWIHIEDLCQIYLSALKNTEIEGSYNAVSPEHITNKGLMLKMAQHYKKPFWLPNIPGLLIKIVFGKMAVILLKGSRISSKKIESTGYNFDFPLLESALDHVTNSKL